MYSRSSWGGSVDPAITVVLKPADQDAIVSLIIFEYTDEPYLGRPLNKDSWEVRTQVAGGIGDGGDGF